MTAAAPDQTPLAGAGAPTIRVVLEPAPDANRPTMNDTLTARGTTADPDGDGVLVEWRWLLNGTEVLGESGDTLRPGRHKKGDRVEVEATPRDTRGNRGAPVRASVVIRNVPPSISSNPTNLNGYRVIVTDPDDDKHTFELEAPVPAGVSISPDGVVKVDAASAFSLSSSGAGVKTRPPGRVVIVAKDSSGAVSKQTLEFK